MEGTKLSNLAGWQLKGNWALPSFGTPGTIQNTNKGEKGYLSTRGKTYAGAEVKEVKLIKHDNAGRQWERSADDAKGYFTLTNPNSGKILAAIDPLSKDTLTIEGKMLCLFSVPM